MAESVDALVSNTSGATRVGSTPALGTTLQGEGAAGYISAALFYFAIGFRQYTGMFLHTLIIYIRAVS